MNLLVRPVTPGLRHVVSSDKSMLTSTSMKPEKSLTVGHKKNGGRNNKGRRTMRHRGGGHKRKYRIIDFKCNKKNVVGIVRSIEYDPNRSSYIALVEYADGDKRYIIASCDLRVGDKIKSGDNIIPHRSCVLPLSKIPVGTMVYNIELIPGGGAKLVRSAGTYAQVLSRNGNFVVVKLPSGETRLIIGKCRAAIGVVSNKMHMFKKRGKAGVSCHMGIRPRVRAVAMNPVDHPMGGGEGKNAGQIPRTRKGKPSRGLKTRKKNKYSNKYIISSRKSNN